MLKNKKNLLLFLGSVLFLSIMVLVIAFTSSGEKEKAIVVASTTSTENSGLFGYLLPEFTTRTGIEVHVVALGTGQALRLARNGDADVLFVHHQESEEAFVKEGHGLKRYDVMYNDFVLVGPKTDPAQVRGLESIIDAFKKIEQAREPFASRGDDSGTHKKEFDIWRKAGVDVNPQTGTWYRETGSGMGATLNTAAAMNAYSLADRGTWLSFSNKGDLEILAEGDPLLFNAYGVVLVSPERYPHVRAEEGQRFIDWLVSEEGQELISSYRINGEQAFFVNAD